MNGRYALDTNIVIALIDGDTSVRDRIATADEIFLPSPVLGELYFGAFKSRRAHANVPRIEDLARSYSVLSIDGATARAYGVLRSQLRLKGKPIPENDLWVAAVAQQWGAIVATRDEHFAAIEGLSIAKW
jgi:tRNA(fMet)-specific endonuclease VapC